MGEAARHSHHFKEERWRKNFEALSDGANTALLLPFGQYICRNWNDTHGGTPAELETFDIVANWQRTLEDNQRAPTEQTVLWSHFCFEDSV